MNRVTAFTLSFLAVLGTVGTAFLVLHMYAMHTGLPWGYSLGVGPFLLQPAVTTRTSSPPPPETRQFSVVMKMLGDEENEHHRWLPATLVANVGDTVILRVTNADSDATHGFALAAYDIFEENLPPGETMSFTFTPRAPGIFLFSCALPGCADDHGDQAGQLIVLGNR